MAKTKLYSITEAFKEVSRLDHGKLFIEDIRVDYQPKLNSEDFVLGETVETVKEVYFNNVTFETFKYEFVSICDRQELYFNNCTFKDQIAFQGGIFHFTNCTFKNEVEFLDVNLVSFISCDHKKHTVYIDRATTVIFSNCKNIGYLYTTRINEDIIVGHSPITIINVEYCNIDSLDINNSSVDKIMCSMSVIKDINIYGDKNYTVKNLNLYSTLIDTALNINGPKVNYLHAKKSMVTGNFLYAEKTAPKIDSEMSVGLVPPKNEIYLYKKCIIPASSFNKYTPVIVKLQVPETAERVYCDELKIRVSEAKVVEFYNLDGEVYKPRKGKCVCSHWDRSFKYNIGETIKPTEKFDVKSGECGSGIHGFVSFEDAKAYIL